MCRQYLTLKEFCDLTKISVSTAYRMIRNGTLPAVKLAGTKHWKIPYDFIPHYEPTTMHFKSSR